MCLRKQEHQKTLCVLGLEEDWQFAQAVIVNVVEPEQISFVSIHLQKTETKSKADVLAKKQDFAE